MDVSYVLEDDKCWTEQSGVESNTYPGYVFPFLLRNARLVRYKGNLVHVPFKITYKYDAGNHECSTIIINKRTASLPWT